MRTMEILGWVQVGASFIAGAGGAILATWNANRLDIKRKNDVRTAALWDYQRVLSDLSLNAESNLGNGYGNHPLPNDLEECRQNAWRYLPELAGNRRHTAFKSPYPEIVYGNLAFEYMEYYGELASILRTHLERYPKAPPASLPVYTKENQ